MTDEYKEFLNWLSNINIDEHSAHCSRDLLEYFQPQAQGKSVRLFSKFADSMMLLDLENYYYNLDEKQRELKNYYFNDQVIRLMNKESNDIEKVAKKLQIPSGRLNIILDNIKANENKV